MRLFPRWHTPDEVAKQLIKGLEAGTLTLASPAPDVTEMIEEALWITAEINAALVRLDPTHSPPALPSVERLAKLEQQMPGAVLEALTNWRSIYARAKALEAEKNAITRRNVVLHGVRALLFILPLAYLLYLLFTRPVMEFAGHVLAFIAGMAVSAWPLLYSRLRAAVQENARLLSAVAELVPQAKAAADVRLG